MQGGAPEQRPEPCIPLHTTLQVPLHTTLQVDNAQGAPERRPGVKFIVCTAFEFGLPRQPISGIF